MLNEEILDRIMPFLCDIFDEEEIDENVDLYEEFDADEYDFEELSMIVEEEFDVTVKFTPSVKTPRQIAEKINKALQK